MNTAKGTYPLTCFMHAICENRRQTLLMETKFTCVDYFTFVEKTNANK